MMSEQNCNTVKDPFIQYGLLSFYFLLMRRDHEVMCENVGNGYIPTVQGLDREEIKLGFVVVDVGGVCKKHIFILFW